MSGPASSIVSEHPILQACIVAGADRGENRGQDRVRIETELPCLLPRVNSHFEAYKTKTLFANFFAHPVTHQPNWNI